MSTLHLIFILTIICLCLACVLLFIYARRENKKADEKLKQLKKIKSQKKSSEVRLGLISEKLAPFLDDFELNPQQLSFLGNPVDFVHFGEDEITIIEVKSGKSRLSKKQRRIRDQVKNKKINWYLYRVE